MIDGLAQPGTKKSILFISHDNAAGELLDMLFRISDYDTVWQRDSQSGFQQALDAVPDFVIIDLDLPGGDAVDLLRLLRDIPAFRHKIIVALCGNRSDAFHQVVLDAGFSRYFCKPVKFDSLDTYLKSFG